MSERLVFDSWQLDLPAVGFVLFAIVFVFVCVRAWRTKKPRLEHLENLPLELESPRPASHVRSDKK